MLPNYTVAIVGGGPAGIALAIECLEMGLKKEELIIFEKGPHPIEAIRKFYPEKKMTLANYKGLPTETYGHLATFPDLTKAQTLTYFDDLIQKYQVPMQLNSEIFKITRDKFYLPMPPLTKGGQFLLQVGTSEMTAQFVAIGIGILGRPNKPPYKLPTKLHQHLLFDITSQKIENSRVLIVGGGDTSSEYAQVLVEEKNEVTLAYRGEKFHRMMESNLKAVEKLYAEGRLKIWLSCDVKEILEKEGKPEVHFMEAQKFPSQVFDKAIFSIGGTTPINFLKTAGVHCEHNLPKYGPSGETNVSGLYLIGDLVLGKMGGSIICCYNASFRTAQHILAQLKSSPSFL